jgi:hypothetical protein
MMKILRQSILLILILATTLFAQQGLDDLTGTGGVRAAFKYTFSQANDALLMSIRVWGEVRNPGIYEVPIGMDLIELLSCAGGPSDKAKLTKVRLIRTHQETGDPVVLIVDVEKYLKTGDITLIPKIQADDTVVVPMRTGQFLLKSISWTQQLINIAYLITIIIMYRERWKS